MAKLFMVKVCLTYEDEVYAENASEAFEKVSDSAVYNGEWEWDSEEVCDGD